MRFWPVPWLIVCACAGSPEGSPPTESPVQAPPAPPPPPPQPIEGWLVWNGEAESAETVWIDAHGAEVARRPGIAVAVESRVWVGRVRAAPVSSVDCACQRTLAPGQTRTEPLCLSSIRAVRASMVDLADKRAFVWLDRPPLDGEIPHIASYEADIVATEGPIVFAVAHETSNSCRGGASRSGRAFTATDLREGVDARPHELSDLPGAGLVPQPVETWWSSHPRGPRSGWSAITLPADRLDAMLLDFRTP